MHLRKTKYFNDKKQHPRANAPTPPKQGCQMVYFETQNPNLGNYWKVLQRKMLVYFMAIWSIVRLFNTLYSHLLNLLCVHLVYFPSFEMLGQEKSGNPAPKQGVRSPKICFKEAFRRPSEESRIFFHPANQGCQIFLGTKYQNGKNILNYH
jgi:hypothetical protein